MLTAADQSRRRLADSLQLPVWLHVVLAVGVTAQVGTAAYGIAAQTAVGLGIVLVGLAVFGLVATFVLSWFRRINGARVDGLANQVLLGGGTLTSLLYLGSLVAATWAAFESVWWLVLLAAMTGGVGYALGTRRWWKLYRHDPAAHTAGASPRLLVGLGVLAVLGLAVLLLVG